MGQLKHLEAQAVTVVAINTDVAPVLKRNGHAKDFTHCPPHCFRQNIQTHGLFGVGQDFKNIQTLF
jgi:hypothetical protein